MIKVSVDRLDVYLTYYVKIHEQITVCLDRKTKRLFCFSLCANTHARVLFQKNNYANRQVEFTVV